MEIMSDRFGKPIFEENRIMDRWEEHIKENLNRQRMEPDIQEQKSAKPPNTAIVINQQKLEA